ncbi:MAG TPA: glycosyltransferase [Bacteroidales bacterium]|nr:glycosyltransferase [Bacteroidales bacterium]
MTAAKINVLFVSSWYPTRDKPTAGNFVQKHAEAAALNTSVDMLHVSFDKSLKSKSEYHKEEKNKVTTHLIYIRPPRIRFPLIKTIKYIKAYFHGYKIIYGLKDKPDIIHANVLMPVGMIAFLLHLFKKVPYVITEHWTGYLPQDPNKPGWRLWFFRFFAKKAARLMPVTEHLVQTMKKSGVQGNYTVVPNVVDTRMFLPSVVQDGEVKHIIHVSSLLDQQKNFSGILLALSLLSEKRDDFMLEVVSDGNFEQFARKYEKLNISHKLVFHGRKNTEEVAGIMQRGDFLLLFSNYENFPCVIAEAMACGLPVLSSEVGGISEHIGPASGLLTEAQNIDALVLQLENMLDTCRSYDKKAIRAYAEKHFAYEVIGKQFLKIYNQVICS